MKMKNGNPVIERVEAPESAFFRENYLRKNKPVILTGVASKWKAFENWTPEYLKEVAGDALVTVHYNESGNFHRWYLDHEKRVDKKMKFSELIDVLTESDEGAKYYMTEHELSAVSEKLVQEVDFSDYLPAVLGFFEPLLFLGRNTCMPMHYHGTTETMLCQLHGEKKITLFSPEQHALLYPRAWYAKSPLFSEIDGRKVHAGDKQLDEFPKFANAKPMEFQLHPGEILFIPLQWWHLTSVTGYQVSVTHFWKADLGVWNFPRPGFRLLARDVLFKGKKQLEKLKTVFK